MPRVTVFMPVYNSSKYIKKSIQSILNQSYKDFELLIIDDGSTDNSLDVINSFNDERIKVFKNYENKGLPYTRNRGLNLASGEYIAIMDSDDIAMKNRLEKQVNFLDSNKDIQIVTSDEIILYKGIPVKRIKRNPNSIYIKFALLFDNYIGNTTVMFDKKISENFKYNTECFVCQDYDFWVNLNTKYKFGSIESPLMMYRTGHENITKVSNSRKKVERSKVLYNIRNKALKNLGVELSSNDLYRLNNFLDFNNKNLEKFKGIEEIIFEIVNSLNINNNADEFWIKQLCNDLLENHLCKCEGKIEDKIKVLNKIELKLNFINKNKIKRAVKFKSINNYLKKLIYR